MNQKGFASILIVVGILVITTVAGGAYYLSKLHSPKPAIQDQELPSQTPQPTPSSVSLPTPTPTPKLVINPNPTIKPTPNPTPKPTPTSVPPATPIPTSQTNIPIQSNITVSVKGQVYSDSNCNGAIDGSENGVANVTVNILQTDGTDRYYLLSTLTTDSNGRYSYSHQIPVNSYIWIQPSAVAPEAHKIYYSNTPAAYLNKDTLTWPDINLPIISVDNLGSCGPY